MDPPDPSITSLQSRVGADFLFGESVQMPRSDKTQEVSGLEPEPPSFVTQ